MTTYDAELAAAREAARRAESVIRRYYDNDVPVQMKADNSPVTAADVESEQVIRQLLTETFPADGFYGEETGTHEADAERVWLVDPIDGTKSFVRRYPFFFDADRAAPSHRDRGRRF